MLIAPKPLMTFLFLFCLADGNSILAAGEEAGSQIIFKPCTSSPNCVSSLDIEDKHFIEPLSYSVTKQVAYQKLVSIIESEPQAQIAARQTNYIHVEFKSRFFGFVDDVEFFFSSDQPVIHVRSASRTGYYDFGVNRRRIETIRKSFYTSQIR